MIPSVLVRLCAALLAVLADVSAAESPGFLIVSAPKNGLVSWIRLPEGNGGAAYSGAVAKPLIDDGLRHPQGIAVDQKRKRLFVADPDVRKIFSYQLRVEEGELRLAGGQKVVAHGPESRWVTVDEVGNVFFSDEPRNLILKVAAPDLEHPEKKPQVVYDGAANGEVSEPGGLAVDNFHLFWANKHLGTRAGSVVRGSEGEPGEPKKTHILARNSMKSYGICMALGNIYYTGAHKSVFGVSKAGGHVAEVTSRLTSPRGCAFDGDGTVYVADRSQNAIYAFPGSSHQIRPVALTKAFEVQDAFGLAVAVEDTVTGSESAHPWSFVATRQHAPAESMLQQTRSLRQIQVLEGGQRSRRNGTSSTPEVTSDANASAGNSSRTEVEFDKDSQWPRRSKVGLAVINGLGLGLCGIDRCYMGQTFIGFIKLLSLSGFLVWGIVDHVMILLNCFQKADRIDVLGFKAIFYKDEIDPAFWLSILFLLLNIGQACFGFSRTGARDAEVGMDEPLPPSKLDA
eukprot:TRINITY_DN29107_c0_g1_i1.p1 TRINITY_DN29107_c0_g1~~TRINITY_DN29107_c0_g1_i1.p1  ORF type:complete len:513 (-),score=126.05 TRINITY_DN29107_c0_g1_i1:105-1643(-)